MTCTTCRGKRGHWYCPECHGEWWGDIGPDCFVCSFPLLEWRECPECHGVLDITEEEPE